MTTRLSFLILAVVSYHSKVYIAVLLGLASAISILSGCSLSPPHHSPRIYLLYPLDSAGVGDPPCGWVEVFAETSGDELLYSGKAHQLLVCPEGLLELERSFWMHLDSKSGNLLLYKEKQKPLGRIVTLAGNEDGSYVCTVDFGEGEEQSFSTMENIYPMDSAYLLPQLLPRGTASFTLLNPLDLSRYSAETQTISTGDGEIQWRLYGDGELILETRLDEDGVLIEGKDRLQGLLIQPAEELPSMLVPAPLMVAETPWPQTDPQSPFQVHVRATLIGVDVDGAALSSVSQSFTGLAYGGTISGVFTLMSPPRPTEPASPTETQPPPTEEVFIPYKLPPAIDGILQELSSPNANQQETADRLARWMAVNIVPAPMDHHPIHLLSSGSGSEQGIAFAGALLASRLGLSARPIFGLLYDPFYSGLREGHWLEVFLPGRGWVAYDLLRGKEAGGDRIRLAVGAEALIAHLLSLDCTLLSKPSSTDIFLPLDNTFYYYCQGQRIASAHLFRKSSATDKLNFRVESPALIYEGYLRLPTTKDYGELLITPAEDPEEAELFPFQQALSFPLYPPNGEKRPLIPGDIYNPATFLVLLHYAGAIKGSSPLILQSIWSPLQMDGDLLWQGAGGMEVGGEYVDAEVYLLQPLGLYLWVSPDGELLGLEWEGISAKSEGSEHSVGAETP